MDITNIVELKEQLVEVREIPLDETLQFRQQWRDVFAKDSKVHLHNCYHCGTNTRWNSYDWNHFKASFFPPHDNSLDVLNKESITDYEDIVIFEEDCTQCAIIVKYCELKDLLTKENDFKGNLYFTHKNFDWTLVFPHEDGLCGPFFVKSKK